MIIGNGMMASIFSPYRDRSDVCIFVSGVSNSRETRMSEFEREFNLLTKIITENLEKTFVYFSTCSVYDPVVAETPYVVHKQKIEKYIQSSGAPHYIFRVTQIVGPTKNETLVSNFFKKIMKGEEIVVLGKSTRNIIDADDVYKIVDFCVSRNLYKNSITDIASPFTITPLELISQLELITGKKAVYTVVDTGGSYLVDIAHLSPYFTEMGVLFPETYTNDIIQKYISNKI